MTCSQCGAPLPAKSNICGFCGALNDTDLRAIHRNTKAGPQTDRICPRCERPLSSLNIGTQGRFFIERCMHCLGIFFDPGELETLIDDSVAHVYNVDHQRLATLIEEEAIQEQGVRYVKCPTCRTIMTRKSYGSRSGVVADVCSQHGVWLDGGELGQLLKWVKAGGQLHDQNQKAEQARREERQQRRREKDHRDKAWFDEDRDSGEDMLGGLISIVWRLMR